jgi:DNA-binding CsgD family transcriptional regulator
MAEWPMVGRRRELAYLRAAAADPQRRGVVLAAPAGAGKTRLARECMFTADGAGMATLVATGSQSASGVPLGAMASILSAFGGVRDASDDPGALIERAVLHIVSQTRPRRLFLLVDDAHLLDAASAALVHRLAQQEQVFLVLTVRLPEPTPTLISALWENGVLERMEIAELDVGAVEELITTVLGGQLDGAALSTLTVRSQGNMLFLRELVAQGLADGTLREEHALWRLVGESAPSDRLVELVEARLGRLHPAERHLLELLAVGEPLGTRELESLSAFEVADRLEDLGLVGSRSDGQRLEVRLAHPVYGEVLRSRLSGLHARRLERALAECLETTGLRRRDDVLRVATWRLVGGGGKPDQLLSAATAARWQYDLLLALRLANAASAAGAGFDASLLAAHLLFLTGRHTEAEALLITLSAESGGDERIRAMLMRMDIAHIRGRPHEMQRLLHEAAPPADPQLCTALVGRQMVATLFLAGPNKVVDIPIPSDGATGDAAFPLRVTRALCLSRQGRAQLAESEIARADAAAQSSTQIGWWRFPYSAVVSELIADRGCLRESIELNLRQYEHGLAIASGEVQLFGAWQLGTRYLRAGRLATAAKYISEALALGEQLGSDIVQGSCLYELALIRAMEQRPREARTALEAQHRLGLVSTGYDRGLMGEAQAWVAVADGDLSAARDLLLASAEACKDIGDLVASASALHSLVRIGRAKEAVDQLEELAAGMDGPWEALYARHARAVVDHQAKDLLEISREFEGLGAMLLAAETAGDASADWQRAGDQRHAVAARRLAAALARQCEGARTPALQGLAVRDQLTPAEQETARYAAAGHSNRAIAERLGLSVRTVEARVQSVYYKLGIGRREDIAAALLAGPTDDADV